MKILITCHSLIRFSGAECMVYDFALQLREMGNSIRIATFEYDFPMKSCFDSMGIDVDVGCESVLSTKYDLVISFHSFFLKILVSQGLIADKFIYFSLSPFEEFETPLIADDDIFGIGYFNSEESRKHHVKYSNVNPSRSEVFPNSVRDVFFEGDFPKIKELKRICVVSNHPPEEVLELQEAMAAHGIQVIFMGRVSKGNSRFIEPNTLQGFDLVLTIGRTVQYSMALGIPVYIYDRFGGPGYLNDDNFEKERSLNFSGRSCQNKLEPYELAEDILSNYSKQNVKKYRAICFESFNLGENLDQLINQVELLPKVQLSSIQKYATDAPVYKKLLIKVNKLEKLSINRLKKLNLSLSYQTTVVDKMKLSISFNFFNGEEYFYQNAFNMRPLADHISVVYQEFSNNGNPISKRALNILNKIIRNGLVDEIILYKPDKNLTPSENEFKKRKLGERIARENGCTHFMSMDTDEFYERKKFKQAKAFILNNNITYSSCKSYFYLKKPIYRSKELDLTNVAFIYRLDAHAEFVRGGHFPISYVDPTRRAINTEGKYIHFDEKTLVMHHMNFIRKDDFKSKLENSSNSGKVEFMTKLKGSLDSWEFGNMFEFPNKGSYEIIEVENLFKLPIFDGST